MADPPPLREQNWHELIEHYTPDGVLGRGLFGFVVASLSASVGMIGIALLFSAGVLGALFGLVVGSVSIAGMLVALTALWPVYLSLIGNIESPKRYGIGSAAHSVEFEADADADGTDPAAILKRRYAAGELTREEFERRLDNVMDTRPDRRDRASTATSENGADPPDRERTRN